MGYEPTLALSTARIGNLVTLDENAPGSVSTVCMARLDDLEANGGSVMEQKIVPGVTHRLIFFDLKVEHLSDIDELRLAETRSESCRQVVALMQATGREVRIVRSVLRGSVLDDQTDLRHDSVLGVQTESLFWPLDPKEREDLRP